MLPLKHVHASLLVLIRIGKIQGPGQDNSTHLPIRMSNVLTVPSTLPAIISLFVKHTDITLSAKVSMIWK